MACNSINSTIEIFTIVLLLVLLVSVLLKKKKRTGIDRLFILTLVLHTINTAGDLAAWRFTSKPGMLALAMTSAGNFCTYFIGAVAYFVFLLLVYADAAGEEKAPGWGRVLIGVCGVLCIFLMGLTLYNYQGGVLYTIDQDNVFTWGAWSGLFDNIVLVQILLMLPIMVYLGKKQNWKDTSMSFLYLLCPAVGALLENWQAYLMLLYPTVAISLLLLYVANHQKQEKLLIKKELELSDSQVKIMVSQIQPHFLYNSLNAIYHLCGKDSEKAQKAVSDFSDYLRMNLESIKRTSPVSFEDELAHVKTYLQLEQMRFDEDLNVVYHIETTAFVLPALSVQPLVENAVKHGICPKEGGGTVSLTTRECQDYYEIVVSDDGVGFDTEEKKTDGRAHIGIENVRQRLRTMCNATLEITSTPGKGTDAVIKLPREERA